MAVPATIAPPSLKQSFGDQLNFYYLAHHRQGDIHANQHFDGNVLTRTLCVKSAALSARPTLGARDVIGLEVTIGLEVMLVVPNQ
jgi:hypothetical protein